MRSSRALRSPRDRSRQAQLPDKRVGVPLSTLGSLPKRFPRKYFLSTNYCFGGGGRTRHSLLGCDPQRRGQTLPWRSAGHSTEGGRDKKGQSGSTKAGRGVAVGLRCLSPKELLPLLPRRLKNAWFFSAQTCADLLGWVIFIQVLVVLWRISAMWKIPCTEEGVFPPDTWQVVPAACDFNYCIVVHAVHAPKLHTRSRSPLPQGLVSSQSDP